MGGGLKEFAASAASTENNWKDILCIIFLQLIV
jgi:hypothetical protein